MVTKSRHLKRGLHNERERKRGRFYLECFQSEWMTIHILIQNEFVQRLVLYQTIENSNIKINRKILLSNDKTLIFVRTRYHKVESENKNVLY